MNKEKILEIVIENIENLIETFPEEDRFEISENTILFGSTSHIDSLSLVSIIVDLEAYFSDVYELEISLTNDRAMTRYINPFVSVKTLVDYIYEIINEIK